jgi:hypothetical protein
VQRIFFLEKRQTGQAIHLLVLPCRLHSLHHRRRRPHGQAAHTTQPPDFLLLTQASIIVSRISRSHAFYEERERLVRCESMHNR